MGRPILIRTLESLVAAEGFEKIEVIVTGRVPDMEVAAQLREFCARHANARHLDVQFETGDSSRKKNEGAALARAPLIAFLDDDVVVAPDWPRCIREPFADVNVGLASGPSLVRPTRTFLRCDGSTSFDSMSENSNTGATTGGICLA